MKKLINEVDNIVDEMLDGMVAAYPQYVKRLEVWKYWYVPADPTAR